MMTINLLTPSKLFGFVLILAGVVTIGTMVSLNEQVHWGVTLKVADELVSPSGTFQIEAIDLIAEPGEFTSDSDLKRFYKRQSQIEKKSQEKPLFLVSESKRTELIQKKVFLSERSHLFWIQIIVGFGAIVVTGWIWSLNHRTPASILFFLSGISTLLFTYSAAIYTTRELFLPVEFFQVLVNLNVIGASLFGISILGLFLIYPLSFKNSFRWIILEASFFGIWMLLSLSKQLPAWAGVNLITLTEMVFILIAIGAQTFVTKGKPVERASLTWLGLSIMIGAGGFITLNAVPLLIGFELPIAQGYAFLTFLLFYFGLGAGIGKYRLFDVGSWAYKILFYFSGAVLLILLDAGLLLLLNVERIPALGVSLFVIGFFYLPLRDFLYQKLNGSILLRSNDLVTDAIQVSMSTSSIEREKNWKNLIVKAFNPLDISLLNHNISEVEILDHGAAMAIPSRPNLPSYKIKFQNSGKSLFTKTSVSLMKEILILVDHVDAGRENYERGVSEERLRIAQDLHDDVGSRLLSGLHEPETDLRSVIRTSIQEIRDIVKGITGESTLLSTAIADLRIECMSRAEAVDLVLNWPLTVSSDIKIDYQVFKTLRSTTRELLTNTMKHSDSTHVAVEILYANNLIELTYSDNGTNFPKSEKSLGTGLGFKSMNKRASDLGGEFVILSTESGLQIKLRIPV